MMFRRDATRRGEEHSCAKLSRVKADQIREDHAALKKQGKIGMLKELAEKYGVSKTLVGYVVAGRCWA